MCSSDLHGNGRVSFHVANRSHIDGNVLAHHLGDLDRHGSIAALAFLLALLAAFRRRFFVTALESQRKGEQADQAQCHQPDIFKGKSIDVHAINYFQ